MKGRFWRKALAASLALLIVTGSVPIKPISNVFESMVVTAEAVEEVTKTYSLSTYVRADDGLSFSMIDPDDNKSKTVFTADGDALTNGIRDIGSTKEVFSKLSVDSPKARFWVLPNVNGKVTKIEFTKACRAAGKVVTGNTLEQCSFFMSIDGMKYNGTDDALTGESHLDEKGNETESVNFTFISTDPEGIEGNLSLWLGKKSMFRMLSGCEIKIHYIPAAEPAHQHNFTYSMNGNTLTATCGHSDGRSCSLADSNHQISVSLEAEDAYYQFGYVYPATLSNNSLFASETGATIGNITYRNNTTGVDLGTQKPTGSGENPTGAGDYTASVTINVGGTTYTLTKDYTLSNLFTINNSYPQFSIGTEKYSVTNRAAENETVTLTFTPQYGETLKSLSVKGATTNYSLENGITKVDDTHYTFSMPAEEVSISEATFGIDENDFVQDGDTYTIKNANGWNYFCLLTNYDTTLDGFNGKTVKLDKDIEVSTMEGMSGHPFKGTFDGQNHTLTFNRTAAEDFCAPFHYINGATISNLHVDGTITGDAYECLGGLVGRAEGNITIENCHVSTQISTTYSGSARHGGVIAEWNSTNATCTVTGCVYDGLIYNPNEAGVTASCRGFIGWDYGNNGTIKFTDCLSAPAAYGTGKYALYDNCYTFVYPNSEPTLTYNMTNCYYTTALGNRQGRPATTATTAPANLGNATTDHGLVKGYENGFLYNGNYYTPKYGDAVVDYDFDEWNERASVTFNGEGNNLVGVKIDEEVSNVTSVTYNRPFGSGVATTVILPFNYECNGDEGGTFYAFKGVNGNQPIMEDSNKLTSLTANTPYLFMPSDNTKLSFPNIANMTDGYVTLQPTAGEHNIKLDAWTLTGAYEPKWFTLNDSNIMVLNDVGELVAVTEATKVSSTSGYFVRDSFAITVNSRVGGTITADSLYAKKNDKVTLTVTPDAGYAVKCVWVNDVVITPVDGVYSFTMPASDVRVDAVFVEGITYTLVPAVEPTYLAAGNSEYYTGSDGKYYVLVNGEYQEIAENSWVIPQLTLVHHEAVAPTCTANGNIEYWYDATNEKYFSDANGEHEITQADTVRAATNHDWNAPTYSWTAVDGGYKCTATRTCKNGSHPETEEVTATYAVVTAPTAGAKGLGRYTATFTNSAFAVQTKDVEIEMLTPEYGTATYTWADDYSKVTAVKPCLNGGADITETVNTISAITKAATCSAKGETTYTAEFTNPAFAKQEKTVENIDANSHNYGEPHWNWYQSSNGYTAVIQTVCERCGDVKTYNATVNSVTSNGVITYTAVAMVDGAEYISEIQVNESYSFDVVDGSITSGAKASYSFGDAVVVKADESKNGKYFSGWYIGDTLITTKLSYKFYVKSNMTVTAKYEGETVVAEQADIAIQISRENIANDKQKVTLTVNWALPTGCTLKEAGLVRRYESTDSLNLESVDGTNIKKNSSTLRTANGTYTYIFNVSATTKLKSINAVAYVTYIDADGVEHTVYSAVQTSNYTTA